MASVASAACRQNGSPASNSATSRAFGCSAPAAPPSAPAAPRRPRRLLVHHPWRDDSGDPGYSEGTSFSGRSLTQAWRWNLDYVEDTSGNAATYWYTKEINHYKKNKATTANAPYVRGGYLTEIKYGLRKDALFVDDADAKVTSPMPSAVPPRTARR